MKVDRQKLLDALTQALPGIAKQALIAQSASFILSDGEVRTFNDEISCSCPTLLEGVEGAVDSDKVMQMLTRFSEEQVDIVQKESELLIKGSSRRSGIPMDAEVVLQVDQVEKPNTWKKLPEKFCKALSLVIPCAGHDESMKICTNVHIHPDWMEATDNIQLARYMMKTGVRESVLARADNLAKVVGMDPREISVTKAWVHFRLASKTVISCRRLEETFPSIESVLKVKGVKAKLPPRLVDAVENANVFTSDNARDDAVEVCFRQDKIIIRGKSDNGWYEERQAARYKGPDVSFYIAPSLLIFIARLAATCTVGKEHLRVEEASFEYISCVGVANG